MLKATVKTAVAAATPKPLRRMLVRLGQFLERTDPEPRPPRHPSQEAAFHTLKHLGWSPTACIDVGAYHGDWTTMFRSIFPQSQVLMVEAQESQRDALRAACVKAAPHVQYEISLLGASDGDTVDFIEMETGSSVFAESSPYERKTVTKRLATLDAVLEKFPPFQKADCLKLDTQGYELEVLKGCRRLLPHVQVLLLEVSLIPVNKGCPLFGDIIPFMTANGFVLFDFCSQIRRRDGVL